MAATLTLDEIKKKILANEYTTKNKFAEGNVSKRFKSVIWTICDEIFDESNQKLTSAVFCTKCKTVFKYNSRSIGTTTIKNHGCLDEPNQTKIDGFGITKKTIAQTDKSKMKDSAVAFVGKDLRPFEALNGAGLFELSKTLISVGAKYGNLSDDDIRALIPSPSTVSRYVSEYAKTIKAPLYKKICSIVKSSGLALTTDAWTDNFKRNSYLAITAHFVDTLICSPDNFLRDQILFLVPLDIYEKKTGAYLANIIQDSLERIGITGYMNKLIFVTDRGANIKCGLNILNIKRLNCFDHLINNTVEKVCALPLIDQVLKPAKKLVRFFKIGGHNNKLEKGLKSFVKTRWNTNFDMSASIDENYENLENILAELNEEDRIYAVNRMYLKEIVEFLKMFKNISVELERSNSPSLFLVWPSSVRLLTFLKSTRIDSVLLKDMKKKARVYFKKNFELDKFHRIATILHPQLKTLKFAEENDKLQTIRDLKQLLAEVSFDESSPRNTTRRKSSDSLMSDYFDDEYDIDEVEMYVAFKVSSTTEIDLLKWWTDHRESFPKLHKIAMFIHAIPATSAPSERKFSIAGKILNCLRSSLDPGKVEDLLFLHSNSDQFDERGILPTEMSSNETT